MNAPPNPNRKWSIVCDFEIAITLLDFRIGIAYLNVRRPARWKRSGSEIAKKVLAGRLSISASLTIQTKSAARSCNIKNLYIGVSPNEAAVKRATFSGDFWTSLNRK